MFNNKDQNQGRLLAPMGFFTLVVTLATFIASGTAFGQVADHPAPESQAVVVLGEIEKHVRRRHGRYVFSRLDRCRWNGCQDSRRSLDRSSDESDDPQGLDGSGISGVSGTRRIWPCQFR